MIGQCSDHATSFPDSIPQHSVNCCGGVKPGNETMQWYKVLMYYIKCMCGGGGGGGEAGNETVWWCEVLNVIL